MEDPLIIKWLRLLVKTIATIAIPIVLLYVGNNIENSLRSKELEAKYVELSVSILTMEPNGDTDNLRSWAIDSINLYAEVKLSEPIKRELKLKALPINRIDRVLPTGQTLPTFLGN